MTKIELEKFFSNVEKQNQTLTKQQAQKSLQSSGILDKKGNVAEQYKGVFVKLK